MSAINVRQNGLLPSYICDVSSTEMPNNAVVSICENRTKVDVIFTDTSQVIASLPLQGSRLSEAVFSPDGTLLAIADLRGKVFVWAWQSHIKRDYFELNPTNISCTWGVNSLTWSSDQRLLIYFDDAGNIHVFSAFSGNLVKTLPGVIAIPGAKFSFNPLQFMTTINGGVYVWNIHDLELAYILENPVPVDHVVNIDGHRIAAITQTGSVYIWKQGKVVQEFHSQGIKNVISTVISKGHLLGAVMKQNDSSKTSLWVSLVDLETGCDAAKPMQGFVRFSRNGVFSINQSFGGECQVHQL